MSNKSISGMSVEDALAVAKLIPTLSNLQADDSSLVGEKLMLLAMKRAGAFDLGKSGFEHYLGTYGYEKQASGCNGSDCYYRNRNCSGEGWTWMRWTGAGDYTEINRSETFKWECSLFAFAYQLYSQAFYQDINLEEMIELGDYETILDLPAEMDFAYFVDDLRAEFDAKEQESEEEDIDEGEAMEFLTHGALFIKYTIDGVPFPKKMKERLEVLYDKFYPHSYMDVFEYFDSFLNYLEEEGCLSKESAATALPFFLDMVFGFRREPEHGCTPVFYVFESSTMARYKALKEKYPNHEYIPQMDALLSILEDPLVFASIEGIPVYCRTLPYELWDASCVSYAYAYSEDKYVSVYYFYSVTDEKQKNNVYLNNYFYIVRQAFDSLLCDMDAQLIAA